MLNKKNLLQFTMSFILLITLIINVTAPLTAYAKDEDKKVVRVGWHETPYFIKDQSGRCSGYSYEYQLKVASYTNWKYEYVEGSWSELLQMLKNGEIDILSDVSYSEERTKDMLFTSIPMGTESYYLFTAPNNNTISADDLSSLNGKRVGVAKRKHTKGLFP